MHSHRWHHGGPDLQDQLDQERYERKLLLEEYLHEEWKRIQAAKAASVAPRVEPVADVDFIGIPLDDFDF